MLLGVNGFFVQEWYRGSLRGQRNPLRFLFLHACLTALEDMIGSNAPVF